jgi:hypothetical protein
LFVCLFATLSAQIVATAVRACVCTHVAFACVRGWRTGAALGRASAPASTI